MIHLKNFNLIFHSNFDYNSQVYFKGSKSIKFHYIFNFIINFIINFIFNFIIIINYFKVNL